VIGQCHRLLNRSSSLGATFMDAARSALLGIPYHQRFKLSRIFSKRAWAIVVVQLSTDTACPAVVFLALLSGTSSDMVGSHGPARPRWIAYQQYSWRAQESGYKQFHEADEAGLLKLLWVWTTVLKHASGSPGFALKGTVISLLAFSQSHLLALQPFPEHPDQP
jgi:hypothetical protein